MSEPKDLVQIIRDNPGAIALIDNDCWTLFRNTPRPVDWDKWTDDARYEWRKQQVLAHSSDDLLPLGDGGYGCGGGFGGDILQALAVIVGIRIEGA